MEKIDIDYLNEMLNYNSETGDLIWKFRPESHFEDNRAFKIWNTKHSNNKAGALCNGYINVRINKRQYRAHRLGWALYYGYFPENGLDHKDRIRHHNWILNLREATQQCNMRNAGMLSNNTSGVKGVCFIKANGKHRANIKINQKTIYLGYFKDFDDAVLKRWKAEVKYKFPNCNTSSSAYNYLKKNNLI